MTLRILMLSTLFPDEHRPVFGNFVERQALALAATADVEVRVVAPRGIPPWPLSWHPHYGEMRALPDQQEWKGLNVYRPRFWHIPATGGKYDAGMMARALTPLLRKIHRNFPFDLIDAQFFFPDGPAAVALGKKMGVATSIEARGSDIHFWGRAPKTAPQILKAGQEATRVMAVSAALKADMVSLGMPEDRITVHHTGIDMDLFRPVDRAATKQKLGIDGALIACVGTLNDNKGQDVLISALTHLPNAHLVLIGQGPALSDLAIMGKRLGVLDRLLFTGPIAAEAVAEWMAAADVVAQPSRSEGLATVWVEALACGTPVVACDVGGAREVINHPAAGSLVPRDPAAFAMAISELLANPPAQQDVRACAAPFTWDKSVATLLEHYGKMLGR